MTPSPVPLEALLAFYAVLLLERGNELAISARHARRLAARGAREFGGEHFPLLVALHVLYPLALGFEVVGLGARPGPAWPAWLAAWLAAQALRAWAMRSLGAFWNVRVWVVPGRPAIRRGPYRLIPHPNYLAVAIELAAGPLLFGAWRTAIAASALNAVAMAIRIPVEERALRWAAANAEAKAAEHPEPEAAERPAPGPKPAEDSVPAPPRTAHGRG